MTGRLLPTCLLAVFVTAPSAAARGQEATAEPPPHLSIVDGRATVEREGRVEDAVASLPLVEGDRIRTEVGRTEVLFADGSVLHLDHHTAIDLMSPTLIRLLEGRLMLVVSRPDETSGVPAYRVDTPGGSVSTAEPGEYRVSLLTGTLGAETELAVLRGSAEIATDRGSMPVNAGERSLVRAGDRPAYPVAFNSASWDAFDRWSEERREARFGVASAQYLPPQVRGYAGTFDRHGTWRHEEPYGYVWYPRVAPGWRPYYNGYWAGYRHWGATWIAWDPWGWPTHHFGRWGIGFGGAWFWIPARRWAPAWVSWAVAPGFVGWCPLGFYGRPVIGIAHVNVFRGRRFDSWHAWTVVPERAFVSRTHVPRHVVNGRALDGRVRSAFVERRAVPRAFGIAVPRGGGSPVDGRAIAAAPRANMDGAPGRRPDTLAIPRWTPDQSRVFRQPPGDRRVSPGLDRTRVRPRDGASPPPSAAPRTRGVPDASRQDGWRSPGEVDAPRGRVAVPRSRDNAPGAIGPGTPRGERSRSPYPREYRPEYDAAPPSAPRQAPDRPRVEPRPYSRQPSAEPRSYQPRRAAPRSGPAARPPRAESAPGSRSPRTAAPGSRSPRVAAPGSRPPRAAAPSGRPSGAARSRARPRG
jgi:hypothetical protein